MKQREIIVLNEFRRNARKQFTQVSKDTGIPVTTVFDYYNRLKKMVIEREVALLDFPKLGYNFSTFYIVKEPGKPLIDYLKKDERVNNLFLIEEDILLVEAVLKDKEDKDRFTDDVNRFPLETMTSHPLVEEFKRECFLPSTENL